MNKKMQSREEIKRFLINNADSIQKSATEQHKKFIERKKFRSEVIEKYQKNHRTIVIELAHHLERKNFRKGLTVFKKLADIIATDSLKDGLHIEEAVDGIIFLKQALWDKVNESGLLKTLSVEEYYKMNKIIGTYVDVVSAKIAFTYHHAYFTKQKELERQKDDFMGIVSHELKTPVTSLKAYGQVLQKRMVQNGDIRTSQNLGKMDAQINRLSHLIHDLLDVTRIEGRQLKFHDDYFEFDDMVKDVIDEVQRSSVKHKILRRGLVRTKINGDRERIGQVLINMLTNAIKFSPMANKVIVDVSERRGEVCVSVIDQGVGIAKINQPRIFERFYRESGAKQETFPGLGVGLYISREILARHNGKIWLKSQKGKGSRFYFTLPVKAGHKTAARMNSKVKNIQKSFLFIKEVMNSGKISLSI